MHMAVGTALGIALLAMLMSVHVQKKYLAQIKDITLALLPGGIIGAIAGTILATYLSGSSFKFLFGVMVLMIAFYTLLDCLLKNREKITNFPNNKKLFFVSVPLGAIATCFGIGMGPLCIPLLKRYLSMQQAIAAATLLGMILVIFAVSGFIAAGYYYGNLPANSLGYIYLPMLVWIGIPSIFFARIGAKLTHKFSQSTLKIIFTGFLFAIGIKMLI